MEIDSDYGGDGINLNLSEQGEIVHKNLKKNEKQLLKNGFFFGRSRLAFNIFY